MSNVTKQNTPGLGTFGVSALQIYQDPFGREDIPFLSGLSVSSSIAETDGRVKSLA